MHTLTHTRADCAKAVDRVYLLDLTIDKTYRLSTRPIVITDADGVVRQYTGGILNDPSPSTSTNRDGVQDDAPSAPMEVSLSGIDVAVLISGKVRLQEARGSLWEVLVDSNGDAIQSWRRRVAHIVDGFVKGPQYDASDSAPSVMQFTLEGQPFDTSATFLEEEAIIDEDSWPDSDQNGSGGRPYPRVVGYPGQFTLSSGETGATSGSPAYVVEYHAGHPEILLICDGWCEATEVSVSAVGVGTSTFSVSGGDLYPVRDGRGRLVTVVGIHSESTAWRSAEEHYTIWKKSGGGGTPNPFGPGWLEGLGDVCLYILQRAPTGFNLSAWNAERAQLNRYKVSTFWNDQEDTVKETLESLLERFPEVGIRRDANGIRPVLRRADYADDEAAGYIYARTTRNGKTKRSPDFHPYDGSMWTDARDESDLLNKVTVKFARRVRTDRYRRKVTVSGATSGLGTAQTTSQYARDALSRAGDDRSATHETLYAYDDVTAGLIALERVRYGGFNYRTRDYFASHKWGWLEVNEVYLLTDDVYVDVQVEVTAMQPVTGGYIVTLAIDDDPVRLAAK